MRLLCCLISLLFISGAQPHRADRMVAITIDDLPVVAVSASTDWASVTERVLATRRHHDVPAEGGALGGSVGSGALNDLRS